MDKPRVYHTVSHPQRRREDVRLVKKLRRLGYAGRRK